MAFYKEWYTGAHFYCSLGVIDMPFFFEFPAIQFCQDEKTEQPLSTKTALLNTPFESRIHSHLEEASPTIQAFMQYVLSMKAYSPQEMQAIRFEFKKILNEPQGITGLLRWVIQIRQEWIKGVYQHKPKEAPEQISHMLEEHKRAHLMFRLASFLGEKWYDMSGFEEERCTFLNTLLGDLCINVGNISRGLAEAEFLSHSHELITCFEDAQNILERVFPHVQMLVFRSAFEREQLLPVFERVMLFFKDKALLKFAQGENVQAMADIESSKLNFQFLRSIFASLQKTGMSNAMQFYEELSQKIEPYSLELKAYYDIPKRQWLSQILLATQDFFKGSEYQKPLVGLKSQIEESLSKLLKIKQISSGTLVDIKESVILLQGAFGLAFDKDIDLLKSCRTLIEQLNRVLKKEKPSLIVLEIHQYLKGYESAMRLHEEKIQTPKIAVTEVAPFREKISKLTQELQVLKAQSFTKNNEMAQATQAKATIKARDQQIQALQAQNKTLTDQVAQLSQQIKTLMTPQPVIQEAPFAYYEHPAGLTLFASEGLYLQFSRDFEERLRNDPQLVTSLLSLPLKYKQSFSPFHVRIVSDAISKCFNRGLKDYLPLLEIITNYHRPFLMFESLYKQGFLAQIVPLPWFKPGVPQMQAWFGFMSHELKKPDHLSDYHLLNCLLLGPYQVLKNQNPHLSQEALIERLKMVFISKIANFAQGDDTLLLTRMEKGLPGLIKAFDEYQMSLKNKSMPAVINRGPQDQSTYGVSQPPMALPQSARLRR